MKKMFLPGLVFILCTTMFGCLTGNNQVNTGNKSQQPAWEAGEPVAVSGEAVRYSLHSVDFLDQKTGWLVKDEYNGEEQVSQILRTADGGKNWENTKLDDLLVKQLFFINKTTGWAIAQVAGQATPDVKRSTIKILRTDDGGTSWNLQWEEKISLAAGFDLWFADNTHGYALISGTLLSTSDGGEEWSPVSLGVNDFTPQHISFVNADTGWVIGEINRSGQSSENEPDELLVLQTIDGGQHWQQQFKKDYPEGSLVGSIDIDFVNETTGWFLTSDLDTWRGDLYYTSNAGRDWEKINEIKCVRPTPRELHFVTPQVGWIPLDVGAGPISGGLLFTQDGGKHFDLINNDNSLSSMREVNFTAEQQGWAVGTEPNQGDYLVHTNDGGKTWTQVFPKIRPVEDISFVDTQHGFGLAQLSDSGALLYSTDAGETWQNIYSFSDKYCPGKLSFIDQTTGWVLAASKDFNKLTILKTTDGGSTWAVLDGAVPQAEVFNTSYFTFFDADNGIMVTSGNKITFYRTQDGGKSWQESKQERSKGMYRYTFVSNKQGWEVYSSPRPYTVNLNRMQDGSTWESLGQIGSNTWLYGIDFISKEKGWILVQEPASQPDSRMKLLVTSDGGQTWSPHPFPRGFKLEMLRDETPIQFIDEKHGWILSRQGLLRTNDGGQTWRWIQ